MPFEFECVSKCFSVSSSSSRLGADNWYQSVVMPKGGGVGGSKTSEEIEAEIEERVLARVLAAKNGGRELAAPRAARDAGTSSTAFQLLTRSNYHDWSLLMRVILQGRGWWKAVETGDAEFTEDRLALEAILRGVPPEMP